MALVVFLARSSSAPAQPTQNRYSISAPILPSTTDRALLHAGTAVGARPQHVRVDDAVLVLGADEGTLGFFPRRLGEGVVAQVEDDLLGGQRLAGGPGRALRLAPAALGAGAQVQQALPGEVLDLPQPEHVGVGVGLLEVQDLAAGPH